MSTPALAQSDLAIRFGAREAVQQISVSPDGERIVFIQPSETRAAVAMVADLAKGQVKPVLRSTGNPDRLTSCHWASNTRLICNVYMIQDIGQKLGFTRLVSVNADGSDIKQLSARGGVRALSLAMSGGSIIDWGPEGSVGSVLMTRTFVPEETTGTRLASSKQGLGVELVDATSLKRRTIEEPRLDAVDYVSDGTGTVRVMGIQAARTSGYTGNTIKYSYRVPGKRGWDDLGELRFEPSGAISGFNPYAVDRTSNLLYGFDDRDGRRALFSIALDEAKTRSLVFAHPQVDVDGLVRIGRQQRVVGVSYATDKRQTEFFDPELLRLRNALGKALPGKPMVTFVDGTADEKKLLLFAGGDSDPGTYYLYDKASRKLEEVTPARPQLGAIKLASVKPIEFPAADGTRIPGYLTLPAGSDGKNLPAIVIPHGGPGARDEWGFDWLAQFFAARGFAVLQPNFRGSTGYGDAWFQKNGFQSWKTAVGDVNDAGRWLAGQGIARPGKLAILGWSYGGYAALQSSVLDPDLFKAVVAIAPVTDLEALREESRNFTNFKLVDAFIGHGDHVRTGSPARNVERIKAPVLLFHGDQDLNVGVAESRLMARKLKDAGGKVELVEFAGLDHQLNDDKARTTMLDRSDQFLRTALGITP
ncbi:S9 family peptidase [Sphingomonas sp. LM7]|uniref:alpha/beta hydrolase family protein n=1 Tax=Sphingomonas sp. LM7 TaxID=1938607 RepID=UPI00209B908B|nr:S9 family peptidase [Sphingomonas sp. LM7]